MSDVRPDVEQPHAPDAVVMHFADGTPIPVVSSGATPIKPTPREVSQMTPVAAVEFAHAWIADQGRFANGRCYFCDGKLRESAQRAICSTVEHVQQGHARFVAIALDKRFRASAESARLYRLAVPNGYRIIDDLLIPAGDGGGPGIPNPHGRGYQQAAKDKTLEVCWMHGAHHREYQWTPQPSQTWSTAQLIAYWRGYAGKPWPALDCHCVDCGGSEPAHAPDCVYMNEIAPGVK